METLAARPPQVKICGITVLDDALAAARAGASYLGYVVYRKSSRHIEPPSARSIIEEVRRQFPSIRHIGVLVDETADVASRIAEAAGLDFAQLHGAESPETVTQLRRRGLGVLKALRFGPGSPAVRWSEFDPDYFLCDTYDASSAGGTGRAFDPGLLPPDLPRTRLFLAGGLTPDNAADAVRTVRPFALDVSSGVELSPGRKSHTLIAQFVEAAAL